MDERINSSEREKWEGYYKKMPVRSDDTDHERRFSLEFSQKIVDLLPQGGKTLEAGSGAGLQSLALARTGKFDVTLLDFSKSALNHAQILFNNEALPVKLIEDDAFKSGNPDYDLVFNSGVLEHYTRDQQVDMLKAMGSHSRRFVLVMVPNFMCYWYWVWRILKTSQNKWDFGEEVPLVSLKPIFEEAGLQFLGHAFLGKDWSESFIISLDGLSDELRQIILDVQNHSFIPNSQKSYLLAGLGGVNSIADMYIEGWDLSDLTLGLPNPREIASQAEQIANLLGKIAFLKEKNKKEISKYKLAIENNLVQFNDTLKEKESGWREKLGQSEKEISALRQTIEQNLDQFKEKLEKKETEWQLTFSQREKEFSVIKRRQDAEYQKWRRQAIVSRLYLRNLVDKFKKSEKKYSSALEKLEYEKDQQFSLIDRYKKLLDNQNEQISSFEKKVFLQSNQLEEIYSSRGWQLVRILWRIRTTVFPNNSVRLRLLKSIWLPLKSSRKIINSTTHFLQGILLRIRTFVQFKNLRMSLYAYYFDRYKRDRIKQTQNDLSLLRLPSKTGMVSIILPVFNGGDLVVEALESVLTQTYTNFEVIAIDDGSTDESGRILDEYALRDTRIKVFHQTNQQLPNTLSRGFRLARGQYLTWISHDNRLKSQFLEIMVSELEKHPKIDMVYANLDIIGKDGQPLKESDWYLHYQLPKGSEHIYLPEDTSELNTYPNNFVGAAFLYRDRVAWLLDDYSPYRFTSEDYDYWMLVNSLLNLRHTQSKQPLYDYRFHTMSLTAKDEELGITRNREKLMVFEDFRRDFFLSPLIWHIASRNESEVGSEIVRIFSQKANQIGHCILDMTQLDRVSVTRLWMPIVYLEIFSGNESLLSPPNLPPNVLKAMLMLNSNLPDEVPEGWDLCLAFGNNQYPPRLKRDYQGWISCPDINQLFLALDVRVRIQHLKMIEEEIYHPIEYPLKVTVIICTYLRHAALFNTIKSVAEQSFPKSDYEVLVVNNEINDFVVDQIVEQFRVSHFQGYENHIRVILCPFIGLSHARNAGISEARSPFIMFIDDDAVADIDWIKDTHQAFVNNPNVGVIGGHIRLHIPEPRPKALMDGWEKYWSQMITGYQAYTDVQEWYEFPWGANWSARREALLEIGGFRTRYGRIKRDYGGGEEIIAASLIKKIGYSIAILPQSSVLHIPEDDRFSFNYIRKTIAAGLNVYYRMQKDLYIPFEYYIKLNIKSIMVDLISYWQYLMERNKAMYLERQIRICVRLKLLMEQVNDYIKRLRKPASVK